MSWPNQQAHDQEPLAREVHAAGRVDERLARLLGPGPRHAGSGAGWDDPAGWDRPESPATDPHEDETETDWLTDAGLVRPVVPAAATRKPSTRLALVRRLWAERFGAWSFGPPQLAVIVVIVLLGLGLAGWSVLRARPVALASSTAGSSSPGNATAGSPAPGPSASNGVVPVAAGSTAATSPTPGAPTGSASPMIKVHVLGAVRHPGVVALPPGSRVQDALDRAGGTKKSAALGDLNLAQPLADGQQVFIARHGGKSEVRDPVAVPPGAADPAGSGESGTTGSATSGSGDGSPPAGQPVNLNTATVDELDQLPGVGPVTAQKIVDWRTQHGRFDSPAELQEVDGIGPKTYADLASMVTV